MSSILDPTYLDLICPITEDVFMYPVTAADGHTYERAAIDDWFQRQIQAGMPTTSPMHHTPISTVLRENLEIERRIQQFRAVNAGSRIIPGVTSDIFNTLDRVAALRLTSLPGVRMPVLIVLGNENSGKSTTLERIIGHPIFPRDQNICTRMVIRVHLRRGEPAAATVSLWTRGETKAEVPGSRKMHPLEGLCNEVRAVMDAEVARCNGKVVIDREILVEIRTRNVPNLDILDLPGLVADNSNDYATSIQELADSVIREEGEFATYLVIVDARQAVNISLAITVVQRHRLEKRALGVFTFLDQLRDLDDVSDDLLATNLVAQKVSGLSSGHINLTAHGWLGLANGVEKRLLVGLTGSHVELQRLNLMVRRELERIQQWSQNGLSQDARQRVGIAFVQERVREHFERFIATRWTRGMIKRLRAHLSGLMQQYWALGVAVPDDAEYVALFDKLKDAMQDAQAHGLQLTRRPMSRRPLEEVTQLCSDATIIGILASHIQKIMQRKTNEWMDSAATLRQARELATVMTHRATVKRSEWIALRRRGGAAEATRGPRLFNAVVASTFATAELDWYSRHYDKLVEFLCNVAQSGLLTALLCEAIFSQPVSANAVLYNTIGKTDVFFTSRAFRTLKEKLQAQLLKLGRFTELRTYVEVHLQEHFAKASVVFARASGAMKAVRLTPERPFVHANPVTATKVTMTYDDSDVGTLANDVVSRFLEIVIEPVASVVAAVPMPTTRITTESCRAERVSLLQRAVDAAEVMVELRKLALRFAAQEE